MAPLPRIGMGEVGDLDFSCLFTSIPMMGEDRNGGLGLFNNKLSSREFANNYPAQRS